MSKPLPGPLPQEALTLANYNELLKKMIGETALAALAAGKTEYLEKGLNINIETMEKMETFIADHKYYKIQSDLTRARYALTDINSTRELAEKQSTLEDTMNKNEAKYKELTEIFTETFPGMTLDMYLKQKKIDKDKCKSKYLKKLLSSARAVNDWMPWVSANKEFERLETEVKEAAATAKQLAAKGAEAVEMVKALKGGPEVARLVNAAVEVGWLEKEARDAVEKVAEKAAAAKAAAARAKKVRALVRGPVAVAREVAAKAAENAAKKAARAVEAAAAEVAEMDGGVTAFSVGSQGARKKSKKRKSKKIKKSRNGRFPHKRKTKRRRKSIKRR